MQSNAVPDAGADADTGTDACTAGVQRHVRVHPESDSGFCELFASLSRGHSHRS
jgi:hypothetical protein